MTDVAIMQLVSLNDFFGNKKIQAIESLFTVIIKLTIETFSFINISIEIFSSRLYFMTTSLQLSYEFQSYIPNLKKG